MATWQAKLTSSAYRVVYGDPPASLDANTFWSVAKELVPLEVPVLLGGSHRRLAPYLQSNIVSLPCHLFQGYAHPLQKSYKTTWHIITTKSSSGSGVREPKQRVKLIHVFCAV